MTMGQRGHMPTMSRPFPDKAGMEGRGLGMGLRARTMDERAC